MMCTVTRVRKIFLLATFGMVGVVVWIAYSFFHTAALLPEAYAAWDTGTLLVEYMKANDDRWPSSWNELLTVMDLESGKSIPLRGAGAGDVRYAQALHARVSVDWTFDPSRPGEARPVTRIDGAPFPVVWEDPNTMVRDYLLARASTRESH